jgi:hypothetical protein
MTLSQSLEILCSLGWDVRLAPRSTYSIQKGLPGPRGYHVYKPGSTQPERMSLRQVRDLAFSLA